MKTNVGHGDAKIRTPSCCIALIHLLSVLVLTSACSCRTESPFACSAQQSKNKTSIDARTKRIFSSCRAREAEDGRGAVLGLTSTAPTRSAYDTKYRRNEIIHVQADVAGEGSPTNATVMIRNRRRLSAERSTTKKSKKSNMFAQETCKRHTHCNAVPCYRSTPLASIVPYRRAFSRIKYFAS